MSVKDLYNKIIEKHSDILSDISDFKDIINESSLSRIWQHVENENRSFAVISSARDRFSSSENLARHDVLKNMVRLEGYGYIETKGGYEEDVPGKDEVVIVEEPSLFIPEMKKSDAIYFGRCFNQDSVMYKDSNMFGYISTKEGSSGQITMNFLKGGGRENLDLTNVKSFFSSLVKGSDAGRRFVFRSE